MGNLFLIDNKTVLKKAKVDYNGGRPSKDQKLLMTSLDNWFRHFFVSHGNIAGHAFGELHDQVNIKNDKANERFFHKDGRSLNTTLTRALYFCGTLIRYSELKYIKNYRPPSAYIWDLYNKPIMYIYNKNAILQLVEDGKADFYKYGIPTYKHDPSDYVLEYRVRDRKFLPNPELILLGPGTLSLKKKERLDIEWFADQMPCDVLRLPDIPFVKNKSKGSTGNGFSISALRIIQSLQYFYESIKK